MLAALASFIAGPVGASIIGLGVAFSFVGAALHVLPGRAGVQSLIYGGCSYLGAFLVRSYFTGGFSL